MTLDKRISDYERINIQYLAIDKPIDLLIFYRVLNQTINKEGREQYSFDNSTLNYHDIPIDQKLKDKLKEFNEFLKVEII